MSLAEELKGLADLKLQGLLTDEEFATAKAKVLTKGTQGAAQSEVKEVPRVAVGPPNVSALLESSAESMDVANAVDVLAVLVGNVMSNPSNEKYHTVKTTNPRLSQVVFSVQGSVEFLASIGFTKQGDAYKLEGVPDMKTFGEAREGLGKVKMFREMREREIKRRKIANEVRDEKRLEEVHNGNIIQYSRKQLFDCGCVETAVEWLKKVLRNVVDGDGTHRKVAITPAFLSECWSQQGTQEVLLGVAGWVVDEDHKVLQLPAEVPLDQQHETLKFLENIESEWEELCRKEEEDKRSAARAQLRAVFDARRKQTEKAQALPLESSSGKRIPVSEALKYLIGQDNLPANLQTERPNREEDVTATRLISEIAALIELTNEKSKMNQGLRNPARIEANRLKEKFSKDRDITYLYETKEEWEQKHRRQGPSR